MLRTRTKLSGRCGKAAVCPHLLALLGKSTAAQRKKRAFRKHKLYERRVFYFELVICRAQNDEGGKRCAGSVVLLCLRAAVFVLHKVAEHPFYIRRF